MNSAHIIDDLLFMGLLVTFYCIVDRTFFVVFDLEGCSLPGIHQGGFLSFLKYKAFIGPLMRHIEESGFASTVYGIQTNPVGYADDIQPHISANMKKIKC